MRPVRQGILLVGLLTQEFDRASVALPPAIGSDQHLKRGRG
jgi:hypothetical protein